MRFTSGSGCIEGCSERRDQFDVVWLCALCERPERLVIRRVRPTIITVRTLIGDRAPSSADHDLSRQALPLFAIWADRSAPSIQRRRFRLFDWVPHGSGDSSVRWRRKSIVNIRRRPCSLTHRHFGHCPLTARNSKGVAPICTRRSSGRQRAYVISPRNLDRSLPRSPQSGE